MKPSEAWLLLFLAVLAWTVAVVFTWRLFEIIDWIMFG